MQGFMNNNSNNMNNTTMNMNNNNVNENNNQQMNNNNNQQQQMNNNHNNMMNTATPSLFGVAASGRPVILQFKQVQEHQYVAGFDNPKSIADVSFFFLPGFEQYALNGYCASIHFSTDGTNWDFLGAVAANKPSDIFRTGWPSNETLNNCNFLQIGISIEPIANLVKLEGGARPVADRMNFAKGIAMNLFHYMESFEKRSIDGGNFLVLPSNALDKWLTRFEAKYRRDPNFFMKKKD